MPRLRPSSIAFAVALVCASAVQGDTVVANSVAVLPFTNLSTGPNPANDWVGESIAEALRETLGSRGLPAISRDDVMSAFGDLRLRANAELTQASVLKLGQSMNADQVVYGTFRLDTSTGTISIHATVSDRARARLIDLPEEAGPLAELDRIEAHLNWRTLQEIAPARTPPESSFRTLRPNVRLTAEESFIRGWMAAAPDQREKHYQAAVKADARFARPMLELGKIELRRKNWKAAADWLQKIEPTNTHAPEASFYLGVAKFRLNDFAGAQAAFESITKTLPVPEVFNNLGVAESRRSQLHALSSFREALDLDPNHPDYHFNMGYILFKTGQYEAAADRFRAVLEREPSDSMATLLLGRSLKGEALRKGNPADLRFEGLERFHESYEEPFFRPPVAVPSEP